MLLLCTLMYKLSRGWGGEDGVDGTTSTGFVEVEDLSLQEKSSMRQV